LSAVVEVPLDLPPGVVGGSHDARARGVEVGRQAREIVDQDPDRAADDHERDQRHEIDGPVDRQRAERLREHDHAGGEAHDHGEQRRPHAADAGHRDHADQQAEEDAAEAERRAERKQRRGDRHRRDDGEHPRQAPRPREAQRVRCGDPEPRALGLLRHRGGRRGADGAPLNAHADDGSR
jgi:hypothetical protein